MKYCYRTQSCLQFEERKLTLEILHHLQEISRRRLYAYRGFGSLFEYVTKELGYSDAAAMRLLTEIPEMETKIKTGAISLSIAAQAQKLFQSEAKLNKPFDLDEKKKILENLASDAGAGELPEGQIAEHQTTIIAPTKPA